MGARSRLNVAVVNGALLIAAIAGFVLESWLVFAVVATVLILGGLIAGDIRPRPTKRN